MSESTGLEMNGGRLQDFTIDQMAGAIALSLGAVGTLLLVIWQSRCVCRCRLGFSGTQPGLSRYPSTGGPISV